MQRVMNVFVGLIAVAVLLAFIQEIRHGKDPIDLSNVEPFRLKAEAPPEETQADRDKQAKQIAQIQRLAEQRQKNARTAERQEREREAYMRSRRREGAEGNDEPTEVQPFSGRSMFGSTEPRTPSDPNERSERSGGNLRGELDSDRESVRVQLERLFRGMASEAPRLVRDAARHGEACGNETQGECGDRLLDIGRRALAIGATLEYARQLTRKSRLNPGEVRDLRKKYGLEDGVWDQLGRIVMKYRHR